MATSPTPAPRYKIFISYTDDDRNWVRGALLPALGLPQGSFATVEDLGLGEVRADEFERLVIESACTLLVLTPAYLTSQWDRFTERLATYASLDGHRVIPLVLEPCEIPVHLKLLEALQCADPARWPGEFDRLRNFLSVAAPAEKKIECPYPGVLPYGAAGAAAFFGREQEVGQLASRLELQSFLIVIGASGCGKSSLVFAGVVPALERTGRWLVRSMRPGAAPEKELAALLAAGGEKIDWAAAMEALLGKEQRGRLLLVIDQLEEVFSLAPKPARASFLSSLRQLSRSPRCVALMTLRSDFVTNLLESELAPIDPSEQIMLSRLRGAKLREAIVKPAEELHVYLEPRLVDRLMTDAADEPGALPMLQETLVTLWGKMDRRLLTERAYRELDPRGAGIAVALSLRGEAALASLSPPQRIVAKRILLRLISFGEGRADTRRRQPVSELRSASDSEADFNATLECLAHNRILAMDAAGKEVRVDLAHECLITGWPTLRAWVETWREAELKRQRLVSKAKEWVRLGGRRGGLLDEIELKEAADWIGGTEAAELGVDPRLEKLIEASRRQIRLRRVVVAGVLALFVAVIAVAAWIFIPRVIADQARALIQPLDLQSNQGAVRKALLAVSLHDMPETRDVLHEAVQAMQPAGCFPFDGVALAFNQDGSQLAGASSSAVMIEDSNDRVLATLQPPAESGELGAVAFRPGKAQLAAVTAKGNLIVWDLRSGSAVVKDGHRSAAISIAYSRAGDLLATGSEDATILIRDAETLEIKRPLQSDGRVASIAFGPDGKRLAGAGGDVEFAARLWDVATGQVAREFRGYKRQVRSVAFDSKGERLATASDDGRLRIWDLRAPEAANPKELSRPGANDDPEWMANNAFSAVAFDDDQRLAATMSVQNSAEIWDIASAKPIDSLPGHQGGIRSLAYSDAGRKRKLATLGVDGKIRIYWLNTPDLIARAKLLLGDRSR